MALPAKLFRFKIELSDTEKDLYRSLDFRAAQHPSENFSYLLTRVLAYALSFEDGLDFSAGGLSDPDQPCLRKLTPHGDIKLWIEIGNPSARKLNKACKLAERVQVYTYKDPQVLLNELSPETIFRKQEIEIYSIANSFLENLAKKIKKENRWNLMCVDGMLMLTADDFSEQTELIRHLLESKK